MNARELDLAQTYIQSHIAAAARDIESQRVDDAKQLLLALPSQHAHRVLMQMLPPYAARLCRELPQESAANLLADGDANQVVAILRCLSTAERKALLKHLPEKIVALCRLLLSYAQDTIGAWMIADLVSLPANIRAEEALARLANAQGVCDSDTLPVVNSENHLIGLLSVRRLLRAKRDTEVTRLLEESRPALSSQASLVSVTRHEGWQNHDSLVVLNRHRQLVGLLRHVDLRRGIEQASVSIAPTGSSGLVTDIGQNYLATVTALLGLLGGPNKVGGRPQ